MDVLPPKGTDISRMLADLEGVQGRVDGINVAEMPSATMRLGSLPVCAVLKEAGFEPILQVTTRDRNRLALQSDLLGASVLGIENVLVLGGDPVGLGDHPHAKPVFDLDTVAVLSMARRLEQGRDMSGHALQGSPSFCLGASVAPTASSWHEEIGEMAAKAEAGAQFFQTQPIYDMEVFDDFMQRAKHIRVPVLGGVFLLKSARMARYMNDHVPEVTVPEWVIRDLEDAPDPLARGCEIAVRILQELQGVCAGAHVMTVHGEAQVPTLLEAVGL
jgi:methylenetetrahydrofolate reductase (NADPH)